MKLNIYFLLICFICLQSCNKNNNEKSDTEKLNLNGKIKSITENSFHAIEKFGEIIKGKSSNNLLNKENHQMIYNNNGYLIEEKNEPIYYRLTNKYNSENKVVEVKTFDESGVLTGTTIKKYDKKGNENEYSQFYQGKLVAKGKFLYDDKGNRIEHKYYNENGDLESMQKNTYDNQNNLIGYKYYDANGVLGFSSKYVFDSSGNEIESVNYNSLGNIDRKTISTYNSDNLIIEFKDTFNDNYYTEKYTYKFDSNKNWIEKIVFKNGKPESIIERTIEYY
ncbi:hypothetical protein [Flavobacterium psychrophilum]|uniref:hypothetical protein n=1 Tax=Flavobacterium psychrophilum TaxID=96345 RepID=UPI000B7C2F13|nr:hypothetical protein [Flavobacterium psychrophilum]SNA74769.1 Putative lipoprotein precursor [Flavobacterium psychrophilum]